MAAKPAGREPHSGGEVPGPAPFLTCTLHIPVSGIYLNKFYDIDTYVYMLFLYIHIYICVYIYLNNMYFNPLMFFTSLL